MQETAGFRVLVVVPTLGERRDSLERTLSSLSAGADSPIDLVMVCPLDTGPLRDIACRWGARLILDQGHISAAINRGFATAGPRHRYLAWIGDDDLLPAAALLTSASLLEQNPDAVLSYGDCEYIDSQGRNLFVRRPPRGAGWWMQFVPGLIKSEACLFRRDALLAVGGLDERLRYAMDLDLILRLRSVGRVVRCPGITGKFGWHPGSITITNRESSFTEAQLVQRRASRGLASWVSPLIQPLLKRLFLSMCQRIDRRYTNAAR